MTDCRLNIKNHTNNASIALEVLAASDNEETTSEPTTVHDLQASSSWLPSSRTLKITTILCAVLAGLGLLGLSTTAKVANQVCREDSCNQNALKTALDFFLALMIFGVGSAVITVITDCCQEKLTTQESSPV